MTTKILQEQNDLSEAKADIESRVVRNVILIRPGMSKNRKQYPEDVLQKSAPIFEGSPAFADHPQKPGQSRSFRDITGQYTNVRYEDGALRADRVFARTQAGNDAFGIAQDVIEGRLSATIAGLSINAVGTGKAAKDASGDFFEVQTITAAKSVDDVAFPAASGSYKESANDDLLTDAIQQMEYAEWYAASGKHIERHKNEMKTVRQDDALKAAKTDAETAQQALNEAQTVIDTLKAERDAALVEAQSKARELALEKALNKAQLPATWKNDLREQLAKAEPDEWETIIEREISKAKTSRPIIPVTGAGQQVGVTETFVAPPAPQSIAPRDDEDSEQWARRISKGA